jgi:hypothetical protein
MASFELLLHEAYISFTQCTCAYPNMERMVDEGGRFEIFPNGHPKFLTRASKLKLRDAQLQSAMSFNVYEDMGKRQTVYVSEKDVGDVMEAVEGGDCAGLSFDRSYGDSDEVSRSMKRMRKKRRAIVYGVGGSSRGGVKRSGASELLLHGNDCLPEPVGELECSGGSSGGADRRLVTLRLRALNGKTMPELAEGSVVVGMYKRREDGGGSGSESENSGHSDNDDDDDGENRARRQHSRAFKILELYWGYKSYVNLVLEGSCARECGGGARSSSDRNCFVVCEMVRGRL